MYSIVLTLHSFVRWVVLILAVVAAGRALIGWLGRREWGVLDRRLGVFLSASIDLQLLLGLTLYVFLSPTTRHAFQNLETAMSHATTRYWTVEHIGEMVLSLVLIHLGQLLSKRSGTATSRHRRAAVFFGLATLLILMAIPWPFLAYGRPLLRLG